MATARHFIIMMSQMILKHLRHKNTLYSHTAIPYRVSTGPEQGFPCVVNTHREKPVLISGNPCSHCRDPVFITGISL